MPQDSKGLSPWTAPSSLLWQWSPESPAFETKSTAQIEPMKTFREYKDSRKLKIFNQKAAMPTQTVWATRGYRIPSVPRGSPLWRGKQEVHGHCHKKQVSLENKGAKIARKKKTLFSMSTLLGSWYTEEVVEYSSSMWKCDTHKSAKIPWCHKGGLSEGEGSSSPG